MGEHHRITGRKAAPRQHTTDFISGLMRPRAFTAQGALGAEAVLPVFTSPTLHHAGTAVPDGVAPRLLVVNFVEDHPVFVTCMLPTFKYRERTKSVQLP